MTNRSLLARRLATIAVVVAASGSLAACSHPRDVFDPAYNQQRRWDRREEAAYRRWEGERRASHVDYARRSAEEQRDYWRWRHDHADR